ncbi:(d)CMP kinase [Bacillus carboniphilus]|uniref:Cytidylate kinase n=1 Tax=Bacillus carboniphilus TaxID=86663 RepID=A0ABY9JZ20_9BACI|nr:(d)CMP kinase [Bacillus carboniphilus]WLR43753.1 (d)CMP kinase [Bacillus carboniphilus]
MNKEKNKMISIAIDGPAEAGKSTVAKVIAKDLSYVYIDTGAMYRALTFKAIQKRISLDDEGKLVELLNGMTIELVPRNEGQAVFVNGEDVTEEIRSNEVSNHVSIVAQHPQVRHEMVHRQREMSKSGGVVMDGRDIGSYVLPNAELKIFMKASVEERAQRRHNENLTKGIQSNLMEIQESIARRDKIDSEREMAPLIKAEDAIEIDTTSLSISEVIRVIENLIKERV